MLDSNKRTPYGIYFDIIILGFMVSIYPLLVIPNSFTISYFSEPRYFVLALVAMTGVFYLFRERVRLNHPVFMPLAVFLGFMLLSTLIAPLPDIAWVGNYRCTGLTTYLFCIILFILAWKSDNANELIRLMIGGAVLVSILAVLQNYGINLVPHETYREGPDVYGTLGNSNWLGSYTVFILPAAIIIYLQERKLSILLASALIYAGLLVSMTRGAWLVFMVISIIIGVHFLRAREKNQTLALARLISVLFLVTLMLGFSGKDAIFLRFLTIPGEIQSCLQLNDIGLSGRIQIWKEVIRLLPSCWAFGLGLDNLGAANILINNQMMDKAHNIYLEMAITAGVFSLVAYLWFVSFFFRRWPNEQGFLLFVMILTYLLQGLSNNDVIMVMPLFWIVMGLGVRPLTSSRNASELIGARHQTF